MQSNAPIGTLNGMCNDTGTPYDRTACPQNNTICNSTYLYGSKLEGSAYKRLQADPFKPDPAVVKTSILNSPCLAVVRPIVPTV